MKNIGNVVKVFMCPDCGRVYEITTADIRIERRGYDDYEVVNCSYCHSTNTVANHTVQLIKLKEPGKYITSNKWVKL